MNQYRKLIAGMLAVLISAGITGTFAYAKSMDTAEPAAVTETVDTDAAQLPAAASDCTEKDETVYVIAGADGSVQKIIVSDWLRNGAGEKTLEDISDLTDIHNVRSDAGYSIGSDGALVWDAAGDDLYYQGTSDNALPVDLAVSYELDGKPITAEELAGKSGKVRIRYDYTNNQYETVKINGKDEKIYVPFAMLTGLMLDNEHFHNIEISNGRIISDGNRTIAAGFALPGMQETLGLDPEKLELPDYVEITADVTDFRLGMTVTIAAGDLFGQIDTDRIEGIDDLKDAADQLTDAMDQLMDGSSQLYDGLTTLLDKSGDLVKGIKDLADGAKQLRDGTETLETGAGKLSSGTSELSSGAAELKSGTAQLTGGASQLSDGASQLADGLNTLTGNSAALNDGAKQVFETLLGAANTQIAAAGLDVPALTVENYADTLTAVIASLDSEQVYQTALAQVKAAVEENRPVIAQKVTEAVREQVTAQVQEAVTQQVRTAVEAQVEANLPQIRAAVIQQAANMSAEEYDAAAAAGMIPAETQAQIEAAITQTAEKTVDDQMESAEVQAQIKALTEQNTDAQMQSAEVQALIAQNTQAQAEKAIADNMAGEAVQSKLQSASAGAQSLIALKTQLDSYRTFYVGLQQYTAGVDAAAVGANSLKDGADSLKAGADQIDSGAGALQSGASQVSSGAGELKNGAASLKTGAGALYDGILKLQDGVPALTDGITKLKDGAMQLSDGLSEFDEQGIQKLTDAVSGDLDSLVARIRAAADASKHYASYSGKSDSMDGKVRFVYKTAEIEN